MKFARSLLLSAALTTNAIAFSKPVKFSSALESRDIRSLLPADLTSAEFAQISPDILERALFSARVINAQHLQVVFDAAADFDAGLIDFATARLRIKDFLGTIDYEPEEGTEGGLQDFSSDPRINLQISMAAQQAAGYGDWKYNQQQPVLDRWPGQELFDAAPYKHEHRRDWVTRWEDAGGQVFDGKLIALRNEPIWTAISRFGTPYPPFDFNSYWRTRLVDRDRCVSLGIIDRKTQIKPQDRGFNQDLRFTADVRAAALRQVLTDEGYAFVTGTDGKEYLTIPAAGGPN